MSNYMNAGPYAGRRSKSARSRPESHAEDTRIGPDNVPHSDVLIAGIHVTIPLNSNWLRASRSRDAPRKLTIQERARVVERIKTRYAKELRAAEQRKQLIRLGISHGIRSSEPRSR